jgi:hypothetical protein
MKEVTRPKIRLDRCVYSTNIEYDDLRVKNDKVVDKRLAPTIQESVLETIPENIRL